MSNELYHHGVKGMKWGVRKEDYKAMSRADRKATRNKFYRDNPNENRKKRAGRYGIAIGGNTGAAVGVLGGAAAGAAIGSSVAGPAGAYAGYTIGAYAGTALGTLIGSKVGRASGRAFMQKKIDTERIKASEISQDYVDAGRGIVEPIKNTKFKIEK